MIRTTLGKDLQTRSVLVGKAGTVKTAYLDPREEMNPGEVLASALGACMLTMVGYMASKRNENVEGTEVQVEPVFDDKHSRLVRVNLTFKFPDTLSAEQKAFYTVAAQKCPVHNSLREDVEYTIKSN